MSFRQAIRRYFRWVAIILVIAAIATVCAIFVLSQERLSSPFAKSYDVRARFTNLTAVAPGLGEAVNVAGVRVGQIAGVDLKDGQAVATLRIDPGKLRHVYRDARATLVPNTPLKDMQIDLAPGTRRAGVLHDGVEIPSTHTVAPIDADEFLAALDGDTRAWMESLIADLGRGVDGRGRDLRAILKSLGPTTEQLRQIGDLLASRRHQLPQLVHDLSALAQAAGGKDRQLARLVAAGNATVGALASQDGALRESLQKLPGTLDLAGDTLTRAGSLSEVLRPTLEALMPTARRLPATLRDTQTIFKGGALLPLRQLRRFVSAAQPLVASVPPAVTDISAQIPPLTDAFKVLGATTNALAYNPGGANRGYLYWLAWFAHNADSVFSTQDAHGSVVRGLVMGSCNSLNQPGPVGDVLSLLAGNASGCSSGGAG